MPTVHSDQQAEDTTYNGWKNYPTWCVALWLDNDEPLYRATLDLVRGVLDQEHPTTDVWTVEESRRFNVADALKHWVRDELAPDLGASFTADLLGYALDEVDWYEIADAWIESAADTA